MKTLKYSTIIMVVLLVIIYSNLSISAVSSQDADKLGTTLTRFGAEIAGNNDGTIPPYAGGLTKAPVGYKPGSGIRPDPYTGEKPLFSINAQNMTRYADKLTEGTKAMMKKFPSFRIDVYKAHRTVAYPENVLKNTAINALKATTYNGGLSMKDAHAGIPFPIPKDGYEIMWNHHTRFMGRATEGKYEAWIVDSKGRPFPSQFCILLNDYPYYEEDQKKGSTEDVYWRVTAFFTGPPRRAGEGVILINYLNSYEKPRTAYQYLPGQRRVKLCPEFSFDGWNPAGSGVCTYDEAYIYNGSMERYNFKFIGKKEFYVPYNAYRATFMAKREELLGPGHLNPDVVRWELHRMWVVEATLRPGERHVYARRVFYVDEDSWSALANENYDAHGVLYKVNFAHQTQSYDAIAPWAEFFVNYNFMSDNYYIDAWPGHGVEQGHLKYVAPYPDRDYAPNRLVGKSIR